MPLLEEVTVAARSAGRTKLKALLSDYRKQLAVPRAQSVVEAKWRTGADNARYMAAHGEDRWRAWDLGLDGTPIRWVRASAKLRLQGALACSSTGVPPRCRLCGGCLETAHHLLVECAAGRRVCDEWAMRQGIPLPAASAARVHCILGGGPREHGRSLAGLAASLEKACQRAGRATTAVTATIGQEHRRGPDTMQQEDDSSSSTSA